MINLGKYSSISTVAMLLVVFSRRTPLGQEGHGIISMTGIEVEEKLITPLGIPGPTGL